MRDDRGGPDEGRCLIERADALAERAHRGAVDKNGAPYIEHPRAVARALSAAGESAEVVAVALLHDVVEDTNLTLEDLRAQGYREDVVDGVDAMTYRRGETRVAYITRAMANPYGRKVKPVDIDHNYGRLHLVRDDVVRERLASKYEKDKALIAELLARG